MMDMKPKKKLSQEEASAKMKVLQDIMDQMDGMMKEGLDGKSIKKVTVASDSKEGLKKGLEKAEEVVEGQESEEECEACKGEGCPACDAMEEESSEEESESEADLDKKIAELMAKKEKIKKV